MKALTTAANKGGSRRGGLLRRGASSGALCLFFSLLPCLLDASRLLLPCLAAMLSDADFLAAVQHQLSTGLTLSKKTITVDVVSDPN